MTATKYTARINGTDTEFARSTKATVVAHVEALRKGGEKGLLEVVTGTGHVAFAIAAARTHNVTKHTKPFTKTIALPKGLHLPKGYAAAYERPKNDALVARNLKASKDERYVVVRRTSGEVLGFTATTREAGQVMIGAKVAATA